jgi:S-adenosylmethionine-diacylglycerol 3-amino-3-carboxypropyl transferase
MKNVDFNVLRYATCWEDAHVLDKTLSIMTGDKVLSICSGGDNSFILLKGNPTLLVAVDISPVQLYLTELKMVIIYKYDHAEVLEFLGYNDCKHRLNMYKEISHELSKEAFLHWEANHAMIERGLIHEGKFEKYLRAFAKYIVPLIHSKKEIDGLLREKSEVDQALYFDKVWDTFLWRSFFKVFFSRYVMGKFGRDPQFLKEVNVDVATYIRSKADSHMKSVLAQNNLFLHYCLKGGFGHYLPEYLLKENFYDVKSNLGKMKLHLGFVQDVFNVYGSFDKMNLSNIFEYMNQPTFEDISRKIISHLNPEGRVAYLNLMVERDIAKILPSNVVSLHDDYGDLLKKDIGFFYRKYLINQKV